MNFLSFIRVPQLEQQKPRPCAGHDVVQTLETPFVGWRDCRL